MTATLLYGCDPVEEAIASYVYGGISIETLEWQLDRALGIVPVAGKTEWLDDREEQDASPVG